MSLIHIENQYEYLDIPDVLMTIDNVVKYNLYKEHENTLYVYDFMRTLFTDEKSKINNNAIVLSSDPAISSSVITGLTEKYLTTDTVSINGKEQVKFDSNLKVLYFGNSCKLDTNSYTTHLDFSNSLFSNAIGITETFTNHNVNLNPKNLYSFVNNINDDEKLIIDENGINCFTFDLVRKKGWNQFLEYIIDEIKFDPVAIVFDLDAFDFSLTPSVVRNKDKTYEKSIQFDELQIILKLLQSLNKIVSVNINSYFFGKKENKELYSSANKITAEFILKIIENFTTIEKNNINIFDDDTRFLIWKSIDIDIDNDKEDEIDHGWYILRGIDIDTKVKLLESIDDDTISNINIDIDGENVNCLVSVTTIKEQNEKSYYSTNNIYDCCLRPEEKISMVFELITPYKPDK